MGRRSTLGTLFVTTACACGGGSGDHIDPRMPPGAALRAGGELRVERLETPDGPVAVAQAFFIDNAVGDVSWAGGGCVRVEGGVAWPTADLASKAYANVGDEVLLEGGGQTIALQRFEQMEDMFATLRQHEIVYRGSDGTRTILPSQVLPDTSYEISYAATPKLTHPKVYLPADYVMISPPVGSAPVTLASGADAVFEFESRVRQDVWTPEENIHAELQFIDTARGLLTHVCTSFEPGPMVVPASTIAELATEGSVIHSQKSHYADVFKDRRFDILGGVGKLSPYQVQ